MGKKLMEIEHPVYPYTCAIVNNQLMGFLDEVEEIKSIELLPVTLGEGRRTFERSIAFLATVAIKRISPKSRLNIMHSIGDALYGEIENPIDNIFPKLKEEIYRLVSENKPINKIELTKETAIRKLEKEQRVEDIRTIEFLAKDLISLYELEGIYIYFAGPIVPYTGMLKVFEIIEADGGILFLLPDRKNPNSVSTLQSYQKLLEAFNEGKKWANLLEVRTVGELNKSIINGKISNIIKIQEALHEKKISNIAETILSRNARVILIAGPSSSGKTTFAKKLEIHLRVLGLKPFVISTDNYFIDRDKTPLDENGNPNFDALEATDSKLLETHINKLLQDESAEIPKYNFITGKREKWKTIRLEKNGILIIEGIHALNPVLTENVQGNALFKIYVSALSQLNIDNINRIPTRDTRLIRRIVRDAHFRGISPQDNLRRWKDVVSSEEKYIFPYQENADVMFNSALIYELAVLKNFAEIPLRAVEYTEKEYAEALRLLNFLSHVLPYTPDEIPPTSILREFIGKSSFKY
ncbi:MAG: hypothetical protein K6343_01320 [Caldisericaceae bacterium]